MRRSCLFLFISLFKATSFFAEYEDDSQKSLPFAEEPLPEGPVKSIMQRFRTIVGQFIDNSLSRIFNTRIYLDALFQVNLAEKRAAACIGGDKSPYLEKAQSMKLMAESILVDSQELLYKQKRAIVLKAIFANPIYQLEKAEVDKIIADSEELISSARVELEKLQKELCSSDGRFDTDFVSSSHRISENCRFKFDLMRGKISKMLLDIEIPRLSELVNQS